MTDEPEDEEDLAAKRKKKVGSGDDDGSFGGGKAGAGASVGMLLSTKQKEHVKANWRHLNAADLITAVIEFFSELPMRASANLVVQFVKEATKQVNVKSFAIVHWLIEFGTKTVELARNRDRVRGASRDSRGLQSKTSPQSKKPSATLGMKGPAGPTSQ